jgi:type I restriction enzyme S subunit
MFSYPTSPNEQLNIVAKLDGLTQHVEELEILFARKGDALKELTQTILHQAFNGSLKAA